ncbi:MAG: hypothetical protein ACR2M8_05110 [Pyrinomonadaceae bacterium]
MFKEILFELFVVRATYDTIFHMCHVPQKKKVRKISDAVFRGLHSVYTFTVYPLAAELADQPGVYIFSKRVTDRFGGGHHRIICIGKTDSLASVIKMHKRSKILKQYEVNVLCLLREQDEEARVAAEADIREAHSSICAHEPVKSIVKAKQNAKKTSKPAVASGTNRSRNKRPKSSRAAA